MTQKKNKITCAIIVNAKGDLLLTKRGREPFKGKWALISGIGESLKGIIPEAGIVEEVRCDIGTTSFKGKYILSLPIQNDPMTGELMVFEGRINEHEIEIQQEFSQGYKWVPRKNLEEFENLAFEHSQIIKRYLRLYNARSG